MEQGEPGSQPGPEATAPGASGDDLDWLADIDLSRMRLTYGLTSSLSLAVNYSFTMREMSSATFSPSGLSEAMKTAFHEVVHVYQMTGTSYGYYCQLLRDFQVNQTLLIVESIRTYYKAAPKLPVARQALTLPDEPAANTIRQMLRKSRYGDACSPRR